MEGKELRVPRGGVAGIRRGVRKFPIRYIAAALVALPLAGFTASPPDLSGVWAVLNTPGGAAGGARAAAAGPGANLPLRPQAKQRHDAFNAIVTPTGDTPGGVCLGAGMPGLLLGGGGYPMEIIQRPEQITMIFELHGEVRRVYFGERNTPVQDRVPGRTGYSSGRWEGDVLVVETTSLVEQLDQRTTPHSDEAVIVERFRIEGTDSQGRRILVNEVKMTDPKFYTEPVTLTRRWTHDPKGHLLPYDCNEEVWRDRLEALAKKAGVNLP